ncbi:MAG: ligand-binding sensor domain-containing protein [Flammeovirgaceae bacterium]
MKTKISIFFHPLSTIIYTGLLYLLFAPYGLQAQSGNFKSYTEDDGLKDLFIYSTAQDKDGYLWIGTGNGVFRFDGKDFKGYLEPNTSPNSFVTASLTDQAKQLWIGHYNGTISKYFSQKDTFETFPLKKPLTSKINKMIQGNGDYFWIVSQSNGIAKVFEDGSQDFFVPTEPWLIFSMAEVNNKEILLGTHEGLFLCELEQGRIKSTFHHPYFKDIKIHDIQANQYGEGFIICTEEEGLYFYKNSQQVEQLSVEQGMPSANVKTVCQKSANELWVGTDRHGVVLVNPNAVGSSRIKRIFNSKTGTKSNYINTIFQDREHNVWVGSNGDGLWEYRGEFFTLYNDRNQFIRVFTQTQSDADHYWLGTADGIIGLNTARDEEHYEYFSSRHPLKGKKINVLYTDKTGKVWVGTDGQGAYRFDPDKPKNVEYLNKRRDFDGKKIKSMATDSKGNIWISTTLRGVFKYAFDDDQFYNFSTRSSNQNGRKQHFPDNIQNILVDSKDQVWVIAPGFGVGYMQEGNLHLIREDAIKNMEFYCLAEDLNGDIWLGTVGFGAFRYNGSNFRQMTTAEGLLSNYVRSIGCDTLGNVWFGSSNGIAKYEIENNILRTFGKSEGLGDLEIHPNSFFKDQQQHIWFGTNKGTLRYDPTKDNYNELAPNTIVTSFQLNDRKVDLLGELTFPYKKYKLRFDFAGISLKDPERIEYEYFLEGFDDEWRRSKERFAIYPKVDDGTYAFKVRAANSDGLWNETAIEIPFTIKKPIWEEIWFYILMFLILGSAIYGYNRARLLRYRRANQLLEEKVTQRTQELQEQTNRLAQANGQLDEKNQEIEQAYQKLVSLEEFKDKMTGMIVHDMKNPLNSIIALSRDKMPAVEQSGKQMLQMVMNILDTQKFEDTQVQLTLGDYQLIDVVDEALVQVTFLVKQKGQTIVNEINPSHRARFDWNIILRVLVNLLTNAIKYSPPSGEIVVKAQPIHADQENFIEVSVVDSGEGIPAEHVPHIFDKFYQAQAKSSGAVRSTGLGLTFCKMVIEAHGGQIGVDSVQGAGSTFYFSIPQLSDASAEHMVESKATGIEEKKVQLSTGSKSSLTQIIQALEEIDIYETSKNLTLLNQIEGNGNTEIVEWKEEMENAVFSFNEKKYQELIQLAK